MSAQESRRYRNLTRRGCKHDEVGSGQVSGISLEDEGRGFMENERGIPRAKITSQKVGSSVHKTKILVVFVDLVLYFAKFSPFAFLGA